MITSMNRRLRRMEEVHARLQRTGLAQAQVIALGTLSDEDLMQMKSFYDSGLAPSLISPQQLAAFQRFAAALRNRSVLPG